MTKHIKGLGFYLVIFAVIMAAIYLTDKLSEQKNTHKLYEDDTDDEKFFDDFFSDE